MRQHLQQVRFTGTEETGNPCAVLFVVRRVVVCVKEFGQIAANLLRKHILVDLIVKIFSSLALITPLMLRSMSLLNSSLKLMPFPPFICVPSSLNEYLQILPLAMLQLTGHSFKPLCFQLHAHLTQILRTIVIVSRQTVEQRHDRS